MLITKDFGDVFLPTFALLAVFLYGMGNNKSAILRPTLETPTLFLARENNNIIVVIARRNRISELLSRTGPLPTHSGSKSYK